MKYFVLAKILKHWSLCICEFNNTTNNKTAVTRIYLMWKASI